MRQKRRKCYTANIHEAVSRVFTNPTHFDRQFYLFSFL